jgi:hypothetical protein
MSEKPQDILNWISGSSGPHETLLLVCYENHKNRSHKSREDKFISGIHLEDLKQQLAAELTVLGWRDLEWQLVEGFLFRTGAENLFPADTQYWRCVTRTRQPNPIEGGTMPAYHSDKGWLVAIVVIPTQTVSYSEYLSNLRKQVHYGHTTLSLPEPDERYRKLK